MKKIKAVILGYGDRSSRYANYATKKPEELEIIGCIDVLPYKLEDAKNTYNIPDDMLFSSLEDFLKAGVKCDVVINGTMDELHYQTSVPLLKAGYNILLEKPICPKEEELLHLKKLAEENNCKVVVCHVLRYTPFYSKIKDLIEAGEIGDITSIQMNEHVGIKHFVTSYVRGKWRSEKLCGSGLLLAKSCHDTDLFCWFNNKTKPKQVHSFGSRSLFCPKNAPEGSAEYCYQCKHKDTCLFEAVTFHTRKDNMPFYTWAGIGKPLDQISLEEKIEFLKHDTYGKCVYKTDMDIVDRQAVTVEFENGSIATLNVIGAAIGSGRNVHIVGTKGEILGNVHDGRLKMYRYEPVKQIAIDDYVDITVAADEEQAIGGHYGGDYFIMKDLVKFLNGEQTSSSTTVIEDSVNGHLVCYAAEKSRIEKRVVDLHEEYGI